MKLIKQLGRYPDKARKTYFNTLDNYKDETFQNLIETPALLEGESTLRVLWNFFKKSPNAIPNTDIPFVKTDLHTLSKDENVLIWFGHSSYFIQVDGKRFLVDPVFGGNVSPIPHTATSFTGSDAYRVSDMPFIDVLLITHDHWDHLDYATVAQLKDKVGCVVCGLGVGQHFEYWGWSKERLIEKNWYDTMILDNGFEITLTPARHFSGRLFKRNSSLWTSFVLKTPSKSLFLGGDSGYGPHFKEIGDRYGPFDLALLECGQYNEKWPYIHSQPHEVMVEVSDLKARSLMPVHHSKFKLAKHVWNEPLCLIAALAREFQVPLVTPKIGEKVNLEQLDKVWEAWWRDSALHSSVSNF